MSSVDYMYLIFLRTVTAGKIYVEVERARLTHQLAMMKEAEGDVTEAATILQELQVETFGSMERKEKVRLWWGNNVFDYTYRMYSITSIIMKVLVFLSHSFFLSFSDQYLILFLFLQVEMILEQMRLCLLKKDFVRTQIISKKISTKFFDSEEVDNLKLKFYK